jgi:hypothetical protein
MKLIPGHDQYQVYLISALEEEPQVAAPQDRTACSGRNAPVKWLGWRVSCGESVTEVHADLSAHGVAEHFSHDFISTLQENCVKLAQLV